MVADTKITYSEDPVRTSQVLTEALPKLVILRDDLAVGYAGLGPRFLLDQAVAARDLPLADVVAHLEEVEQGQFLVASLADGPQLLKVAANGSDDRTAVRRGWVGDLAAYDQFRESYHQWKTVEVEVSFKLMASMQYLLTWQQSPTVGGFLTRLHGSPDHGFSFISDPSATITSGISTILPMVGIPPTQGALAYYVAGAGGGPLFPAHRPAASTWLEAGTADEFVELAREQHAQHLQYTPLPFE